MTGAKGDEPGRWRTFGERTIYDDPWVWHGQVDVELPGGELHWHHVIRLHRAAVMVLLDDRDQVLMLWRHRFVPDRWGWELPGGLVDADEEPADAAARELEEETGYRAGEVEYLAAFQPMPGIVDAEHFAFVGRNPERVGDPTDLSEAARVEWVPLASVPQMIEAGDIWNAGSLVALSRVLMKGRGLSLGGWLLLAGAGHLVGFVEREVPWVAVDQRSAGVRLVRLDPSWSEQDGYAFGAQRLDVALEQRAAGERGVDERENDDRLSHAGLLGEHAEGVGVAGPCRPFVDRVVRGRGDGDRVGYA